MQYNERVQLKRAENCLRVLNQDGLSEWAYDFWHTTARSLAKSKTEYDYRFRKFDREVIKNV